MGSTNRLMIISSDCHAIGRMTDFIPYMDLEYREEFEAFCKVHAERGEYSHEEGPLARRLAGADVEDWKRAVLEPERYQGVWDVDYRLKLMEQEGVCAEVLIPDFGLPWELYDPGTMAALGYLPPERYQVRAGNAAYNRWLADFVSAAPERFVGLSVVPFDDVDHAVDEIRKARASGLKGVMVPFFNEKRPPMALEFDPIWDVLEELDMPLCSHIALSGVLDRSWYVPTPHPASVGPIYRAAFIWNCQSLLDHLIWGGVFERHPRLRVALTEQGSGWVPGKLAAMDHTYNHAYLNPAIREVVKKSPSEYFAQNCWIGSSLLGRAEVAAREQIGIDKMMVGVDYPHHEGTWWGPNVDYLQAVFGPLGIPEAEARMLLGENAARCYEFDVAKLRPLVDRIGPEPEQILTPPTEDRFTRGDVVKPMMSSIQ